LLNNKSYEGKFMLQITKIDFDTYKITASTEEFSALDSILNHSLIIYDDTELETLLDWPAEDSKFPYFETQIDILANEQSGYRLWGEEDFHLISLVVLELANKQVPELDEKLHKSVYYQFDRLEKEKQKIDENYF